MTTERLVPTLYPLNLPASFPFCFSAELKITLSQAWASVKHDHQIDQNDLIDVFNNII